MNRFKAAHFLELLLIAATIALALFYFSSLKQAEPSLEIIEPYSMGHIVADGWKVSKAGFPDGQTDRLAIKLTNADYTQPAFFMIEARAENKCNYICSKNFEITTHFDLSNSEETLRQRPESLSQAFSELSKAIISNDNYQSVDLVLNQNWGSIAINQSMKNWQTHLLPEKGINIVLVHLLLVFSFCWLVLFLSSLQGRFAEVVLVLLLTASAFMLRLTGADTVFTTDVPLQRMAHALSPLMDIFLSKTAELNHPPLTFLIMKFDLFLLGTNEIMARLPFILAGSLSVPAVYYLTKSLSSKTVGIIAALILALNPIHREISMMLNDFVLLGLFGTLATYFYIKHVQLYNFKNAALFCLFAILTVHSNLLGTLWIFALFIAFFNKKSRLKKNTQAKWKVWAIIGITSVPMFIMIARALKGLVGVSEKLQMIPQLDLMSESFLDQIFRISVDLLDPPFGMFFALLLVFGIFSINLNTLRRRHFAPIMLPVLMISIGLILLAIFHNVRSDYFYFMLVLLAPIAATAVLKLTRFRSSNLKESFFRIFAACITALVLMSSVDATQHLLASSEQKEKAQIENILNKFYYDQSGINSTLATTSNLLLYTNYYFCQNLEQFTDRDFSGFHECTPSIKLYSAGSPQSFEGKYPRQIIREFRAANVQSPYYLFIDNYSSEILYRWARKYCKILASEKDFSLVKCK